MIFELAIGFHALHPDFFLLRILGALPYPPMIIQCPLDQVRLLALVPDFLMLSLLFSRTPTA